MMGLVGPALEVATDIVARFPEVKITSGRRTVEQQAAAMAGNVVKNRDWIRQTYMLARAAHECQAFVDKHPKADRGELTAALTKIIGLFDEAEQRRLSRHITGEAFDVLPFVGGRAGEVLDALREWATRREGRLLTSEGGLVIWHWQVI